MSDPYDIPGADQSAENGQAVKHEGTPPGARLDSSVPGWDSPLLAVRSDSVRTARYRRHQAWFREVQLGVAEAGIGANGKAVSSMLPTGAVADRPDLNFLVPAAYAHAARRIALVRAEGGTLEEDRLGRNLLSSMPLCFNIFGAIGTHPAFPQLLRLLFDPDVADLDAVECEWAPQPPSNHLDDRSAFDAFVAYRHASGPACFVGIETKYTEPFSPYKYEKPAYRRVTEESGWFKPGAYDALKGSKTNQLWRTTMLAASMVDGDRFQWGKVLLLTCADDTGAAECAALVREQLLDPSRLVHTTYEAVVDAARQVDDSDLAQWADQFERRYLIDTTAPKPSEPHRDGPSFTGRLRDPDRVFKHAILPSPAFVEAISWGVASKLVRRHPELRISEDHPGGGTYDCLTIEPASGPSTFHRIHLNRGGSGFVWRHSDGWDWAWRGIWSELTAADDYRFAVGLFEHFAGLPRFGPTPTARPHTVVYRLIAAILNLQLGARPRWRGELDFDGKTWSGLRLPTKETSGEGQRWILHTGDEPVLALFPENGTAERPDGATVDLWSRYQSDRRISRLVPDALGFLAP